jgi:prepilin-type processing-associated H-X9-DG protein
MKSLALRAFSFFTLAFFAAIPAVQAADTNPPPRLTVELRDGSRVVGDSVEKTFKFHSALLGGLKLNVKDIRAVECVATNSAKLTAANGDTLMVSFVEASFAIKTSFGKVELAVNSVRRISVSAGSPAGAHPPGLVALWSGEGDGKDSVGTHDGRLVNVAFTDGKVGRAFDLNGTDAYVEIPSSDLWALGGKDFTIALWANFRVQPAFDMGHAQGGVLVSSDEGSYNVNKWWFALGGGALNFHINDPGQGPSWLVRAPFRPNLNQWYQVAITRSSGLYTIYVNGVAVGSEASSRTIPNANASLMIGQAEGFYFNGRLDEISLYNRALSAEEIKAIGIEENHGEPLPPPNPARSRFSPGFNGNGFAPSSE